MRASAFMFIGSVCMFMIGGYGAIGSTSPENAVVMLGIFCIAQGVIMGLDHAIAPCKSKNDDYFEAMREVNHD